MQWAELDGKQRLLVGGKVNRFIPNPTFDPVARPGAMDEYFRGRNPKNSDTNVSLFGELEPIPAAYRDRDARLALMDEQGIAGRHHASRRWAWAWSRPLLHDLDALAATFRAFNRWMEEDWGFAYQDRIFAAPYITLCRPEERRPRARMGAGARRTVHRDDSRADHDGRGNEGARRSDVRRILADWSTIPASL